MITPTATARLTPQALNRAWNELLMQRPELGSFESAQQLGVSEARLIAARCAQGEGSPLAAAPAPLLAKIARLGTVTAITRSSAASLENIGTYGMPDIGEHTGIVIGENIDLRIFPSGWSSAFAVSRRTDDGIRRSINIFDARGAATHEVVLGAAGDIAAYDELVTALAAAECRPPEDVSPPPLTDSSSVGTDVETYRRAYAAMKDTHDFFMLLHRFGLTREEGLRLAGPAYVRAVTADAHRGLFAAAADAGIPLMIFVANSGMVQISSGTVPRPTFFGSCCELIDPRFCLRLNEAGVAREWAVRKPTVNGIVTSLELYAPDGSLIAQIFGERHAGETERADWASAIAMLPVPA